MATAFEQKIKGKEKVKFKSKAKGDVFRKQLKDAIKEIEVRESKDKPKTLKRSNVNAPKKMDVESSLGDLKKEFKNRFGKEIKSSPRPQSLSKGGRAGYKAGTRGCKLATKGKGRAYGKNS